MKKIITTLVTIALLVGVISPVLAASPILAAGTVIEYAKMAHGTHGLGNVNQNFNGIVQPPPWDLPPGQNP